MNQSRAYGRPPRPKPAEINWIGLFQVGGVLLVACFVWQLNRIYIARQEQWDVVESWLTSHGLDEYQDTVFSAGIRNMDDVTNFPLPLNDNALFKTLQPNEYVKLQRAFQMLQDEVLLKQWLNDYGIEKYTDRLLAEGIRSLDALAEISERRLQIVVGEDAKDTDYELVQMSLQELEALSPNFSQYRSPCWSWPTLRTLFGVVLCAIFLSVVFILRNLKSAFAIFQSQQSSKHSLVDFVTGNYLAVQSCFVDWEWTDNHPVGDTLHFKVKFYQWDGRAYPVTKSDQVLVEIYHGTIRIATSVQLGGTGQNDINCVRGTFTVHRAGTYKLSIIVAGKHIKNSPFEKHFVAGPMDPQKSQFVNQCSVVVGCQDRMMHLYIEPRDYYDNPCEYSSDDEKSLKDSFQTVITETENQVTCTPAVQFFQCLKSKKQISLSLTLEQVGCYHVVVSYRGQQLKNSDFHILLLNYSDLLAVNKSVSKRSSNVHFDARLLSTNFHSPSDKGKKIYCYISPKQLTIKEFHFKIIPKKLYTFRVCPSTRFQFLGTHNQLEMPILSIEDGCRSPVLIASRDRNLIAATFSKRLMKNIGGSETFKDKQDFFNQELRQLHSKRSHDRLGIKISRDKLLESSFKVTKNFSASDWCKNFEIIFQNEEGLDWGGLRREWFELVTTELFDPTKSGLFCRFKEDDPQALVHPNPQRPPTMKLKYYDFAGKIVGKCLYESSLGGGYKQQIKAKFSRSFLAQLIGLRVNYKYFEMDDPDLYTSKIRYIEDNYVEDLDLTFVEEEFIQGKLDEVVELIPHGAGIPVLSSNKMSYLDALAQYRLSTRVQDEIEAFLKGLNELVPDNLLSIFDENELELLMCGTGNYSIADFQEHHTVSGSSPEFLDILRWFWTIVAGYTQEEMARLLQFTTGCSQLPPDGFSQLMPNFQIISVPTYKVLPTAHTCFNQLCLPIYDSLEELSRALHLAITEGNQGFGMV